jgi:predicted dehydrogenase
MLPRDVIGHFDCGFDLPRRSALEVVGSDGTLAVDDPYGTSVVIERRADGGVEPIEVEQADRYQLQLENFGDAIRGRADPLLGREDAVGQARTIDLLYEAAVRA